MTEKKHFYVIIKPYRSDFMSNPKEEENKVMGEHFTYLKSLLEKKKLFLAGPTLVMDDPFGLIIFETETEEEARKLIEKDPSIKAGLQTVEDFRPMVVSLHR